MEMKTTDAFENTSFKSAKARSRVMATQQMSLPLFCSSFFLFLLSFYFLHSSEEQGGELALWEISRLEHRSGLFPIRGHDCWPRGPIM